MLRQFAGLVAAGMLCVASAGCGRKPEEAKPFATPTVNVNRSDAAVGTPIDMTYRFVVANDATPLAGDYTVFVHFLDNNREQMWTDDHIPPTPPRQWKPGQTIEYTRTMFVPKFPYTGPTAVEVGLYDPKSGERVPLAAQDTGMRSYRVATFNLSNQPDNLFVIFTDGWHEAEGSGEGGLEWQWSKREGTLAFRNPKRAAILFLQLDQAVQAFPEPQHVEVRLGQTVLDTFALPVGVRELRRIDLPERELGSNDTVQITIAVDRTFVPAEVPALRSSDRRELGVRVFHAYVQPK